MTRAARRIAAIVAALALAAPAAAVADDHSTPPDPSDPACHGQAIAYLTHQAGAFDTHGLGGLAKALGISVKELQDIVDSYCDLA